MDESRSMTATEVMQRRYEDFVPESIEAEALSVDTLLRAREMLERNDLYTSGSSDSRNFDLTPQWYLEYACEAVAQSGPVRISPETRDLLNREAMNQDSDIQETTNQETLTTGGVMATRAEVQARYTIHDMKRLKLSFMRQSTVDNEAIEAQIATIRDIARDMPNARHMYYREHFLNNDDINDPILDETQLLRVVVEHAKTLLTPLDTIEAAETVSKVEAAIEGVQWATEYDTLLSEVSDSIERAVSDIDSLRSSATAAFADYRDYCDRGIRRFNELEEAEAVRADLEARNEAGEFDGTTPVAIDNFKNWLASQTLWKYVTHTPGSNGVQFMVYRDDAVITDYRPVAGIDVQQYIGRVAMNVIINKEGYVRLKPVHLPENIFVDSVSIYHPHLSSGICWGSHDSAVYEMGKSGDVAGIFGLLDELIATYCPDNPFRTMQGLISAYRGQKAREMAILENFYKSHRRLRAGELEDMRETEQIAIKFKFAPVLEDLEAIVAELLETSRRDGYGDYRSVADASTVSLVHRVSCKWSLNVMIHRLPILIAYLKGDSDVQEQTEEETSQEENTAESSGSATVTIDW